MKRRTILSTALLGVAVSATAPLVHADTYPSRPIRLIIPFAPGGNTDVAGRMIATGIGALLGQPLVADNRGGAGGTVAAGIAAKTPADGYTLLLASGALAISPAIYDKVPYDLAKDFEPIGQAVTTALVLAATPSLPFKTMPELIAAAKAEPGKITYGSAGVGSGSHLAGELFNQIAQIQTMHVPYKGSGPATTAVLSGEVDYTFTSLAAAAPLYKADKVKVLAITGKTTSDLFPGVPTADSMGLKGYEAGDWIGLLAPAGTPKAVVDRLNQALTQWLAQPETVKQFAQAGFEVSASTPQEFGAHINAELVKWKRIATNANIKAQ